MKIRIYFHHQVQIKIGYPHRFILKIKYTLLIMNQLKNLPKFNDLIMKKLSRNEKM